MPLMLRRCDVDHLAQTTYLRTEYKFQHLLIKKPTAAIYFNLLRNFYTWAVDVYANYDDVFLLVQAYSDNLSKTERNLAVQMGIVRQLMEVAIDMNIDRSPTLGYTSSRLYDVSKKRKADAECVSDQDS